MDPKIPIIDLDLEEIEEARRMPISRKLELGGELFDDLCQRLTWIIRREQPEATPEQVLAILRQRFEDARKLESQA